MVRLFVLGMAMAAMGVFLIFCTTPPVSAVGAAAAGGTQSQIDGLIERTARRQGVPGISAAVLREGEDTIFSSFGYADRRTGEVVDENTFFGLGSVSKAFTAMAVLYMDYSDEFDFGISDPIIRHIPWISFEYRAADFDMSELTVAHLVHHTSGITNTTHSLRLPPSDGPYAAIDTVSRLDGTRLVFRPGTRYEYGSANYIILGLVVETVTGLFFEDFLTQRILEPLGLHNTKAFEADAADAGIMATPHRPLWFASRPFSPPIFRAHIPTGFLISNASDMARWMELHLNPSLAPPPFDTLIPLAHIPDTSVDAIDGTVFGKRGYHYYGAGWMISPNGDTISHLGESPGFLSGVMLLPNSGSGVVVFMNSSSGDSANLMYNIGDILEGCEPGAISSGSEFRMFDTVASAASIILVFVIAALAIAIALKVISIVKGKCKPSLPKVLGAVLLGLSLVLLVSFVALVLFFPSLFGVGTWGIANIWIAWTVMLCLVLLCVTGFLLSCFVFLATVFRKVRKS